jgi:hypothetical protein
MFPSLALSIRCRSTASVVSSASSAGRMSVRLGGALVRRELHLHLGGLATVGAFCDCRLFRSVLVDAEAARSAPLFDHSRSIRRSTGRSWFQVMP